MIDPKTPQDIPVISWIIVTILGAWGGLVQFIRRSKENGGIGFTLAELIGETVISSFCGVITFLLCEDAGINRLMSAALVAIAGHMGSRLIYEFEYWATRRFLGIDARYSDRNIDRVKSNSEK